MRLSEPLSAVTPTLDAPVLRVLARADTQLTAPAVAKLAGTGSYEGIRKVLIRLSAQGLVIDTTAGHTHLYTLNREHLAAAAVIQLANLRPQFIERMRERMNEWAIPPVGAILFGSVARGDENAGSDIDLLVIRPDGTPEGDTRWRSQVSSLQESVEQWTGNATTVLELSRKELQRMVATDHAIVTELRRDAIEIVGPPAHRLLEA